MNLHLQQHSDDLFVEVELSNSGLISNRFPLSNAAQPALLGSKAGKAAENSGRMAGNLRSAILDRHSLQLLSAEQWDALSDAALVENPFYSRLYVVGALKTIDADTSVSAFAIWSGDALVGLFPVRSLWAVGFGAQNIYQFNGAPLVHREYAEAVVAAWLKAIRDGKLPGCWAIPNFQLTGPLCDLMWKTACRLGLSVVGEGGYSRPQLTRLPGGFDAHLSQVLGKSRRKEIERCLRRLREKGELRMERSTSPEAVRTALEEFLLLENAGWKGKASTAFLSKSKDADFARAAFVADGDRGAVVDTLRLDGRAIAASVNITSGQILFTPKCTYCESLRNLGPGLVLEYLVIERFYQDAHSFARMDAATLADGHVIQGLWNETVPVGTLYIGSRAKVAVAARLHQLKAALKPRAKLLRDHLLSVAQRWSRKPR